MKTFRRNGCVAAIMLLLGCPAASVAASMDDLLRAYPNALASFDGTNLIWRDGTRMPVDDGRPDKDMAEQLRNGSILDQLRLPYPSGRAVAATTGAGSGPPAQQSVVRQDVW